MRLTFAAGPEALKCGVRNSGCVITAKATGNQAETAKKAGTGDSGTRHWGWNEDHSDDCMKARLGGRRRSTDAHGETGCHAGASRPPAEGLTWCGCPGAMTRAIRAIRPHTAPLEARQDETGNVIGPAPRPISCTSGSRSAGRCAWVCARHAVRGGGAPTAPLANVSGHKNRNDNDGSSGKKPKIRPKTAKEETAQPPWECGHLDRHGYGCPQIKFRFTIAEAALRSRPT